MVKSRRRPAAAAASAGVVGVEVDADRAVAVQVVDGQVVASRVVAATAGVDPVQAVLEGLPAGVRVQVAPTRTATRSVRVRTVTQPARQQALRAVVREHGQSARVNVTDFLREQVSLAGVFIPPAGPLAHWSGLVVAWPTTAVTEAFQVTGGHTGPVGVTAPPLTAGSGGGLVLALRRQDSELTLSHAGVPVDTVALRAGGLGQVEATLGGGQDVGAVRVEDALRHGGVNDPLAGQAVERWLREVLDEVVHAREQWQVEGLPVPDRVFIHGQGSTAVVLNVLLTDVGLHRAPPPPEVARALLRVPAERRAEVTGALLVALAPPAASLMWFPNPEEVAQRHQRARARLRRRWWGVAAGAVAALTVPVGAVASVNWWTTSQLHTAVHTQLGPDPYVSVEEYLTAVQHAAPSPADVPAMGVLVDRLPDGVVVEHVRVGVAVGRWWGVVHGTADDVTKVADVRERWAGHGVGVTGLRYTPVGDVWGFVAEVTW